jgi:hypothetical protein
VTAAAIVVALATVIVLTLGVLKPSTPKPPSTGPTAASCPAVPAVVVGVFLVPAGPIGGYCQPQLINAAQVMNAARDDGLDLHSQQVGVMTAIGESGLRNLNFGDIAGPDSRGIFQQRANWGSLADRMNPFTAAKQFYHHMLGVPGWNTMTPTQVAHAVQANADPNYYTKFWDRAGLVVQGLNAAYHVQKLEPLH